MNRMNEEVDNRLEIHPVNPVILSKKTRRYPRHQSYPWFRRLDSSSRFAARKDPNELLDDSCFAKVSIVAAADEKRPKITIQDGKTRQADELNSPQTLVRTLRTLFFLTSREGE